MVEKARVYWRMLQREPGGASLCCTPSRQDVQLNFVTLKQFPDVLLALGRFFFPPLISLSAFQNQVKTCSCADPGLFHLTYGCDALCEELRPQAVGSSPSCTCSVSFQLPVPSSLLGVAPNGGVACELLRALPVGLSRSPQTAEELCCLHCALCRRWLLPLILVYAPETYILCGVHGLELQTY